MPITTLRASGPSARPRTYCSRISCASRLRASPSWPEAQKGQPTGQPACVETHKVAPGTCSPSSAFQSEGMCTVSTATSRSDLPRGNETSSFVVSSTELLRVTSLPARIGSSCASASRRLAGSEVIVRVVELPLGEHVLAHDLGVERSCRPARPRAPRAPRA